MITVPLSAPLFGLVTALVFAATELLLLSSLLHLINRHVCHHLRQNPPLPPLSIRGYRFRVFLATLFSISLFLLLELLLSLTSDPATRPVRTLAPCQRSFIPRVPGTEKASDPGSEALHFVCTRVDNLTISHATGNRSLGDVAGVERPECDVNDAYTYVIGEEVNQTKDIGPLFYACSYNLCGAVAWLPDKDNPSTGTVYHSNYVSRNETGMPMLPTRILRNGELLTGREQALADGLLEMLASGNTEEGEVRRNVFTGVRDSECLFTTGKRDVTDVQTWALWTAAVIWWMSLGVGLVGLCGRKKVFFDMSNAEHWAGRARHGEGRKGQRQGDRDTMGVQRRGDGGVWIVGMGAEGEGGLIRGTGSWGAVRRKRSQREQEDLEGDYAM